MIMLFKKFFNKKNLTDVNTDSIKEQKKKTSLSQYLLYLILIIFAAPYFLNNRKPDGVISVGNKHITQEDIIKARTVIQQENLPEYFANLHLIFFEEARVFIKEKYPFLPIYKPEGIGLVCSDTAVDEYIEKMPIAQKTLGETELDQKNSSFSLELYQDFLKQNSLTDNMFKNEVRKWLISKQLLLLPKLITKLISGMKEFDTYAQHIWKANLQYRHGEYALIETEFIPTYSEAELKEMEQYYILNQNIFAIPEQKTFYILYFENTDSATFQNIIKDLQNGSSLEDLATKWSADIIVLEILGNNQIKYTKGKNRLSDELVYTLYKEIKEKDLNQLKGGQDGNAKMIYKLIQFTPSKYQSTDYFQTTVKEAWNKKDTSNPVISAWINHKSILLKKQNAAKALENNPNKLTLKVSLKDIENENQDNSLTYEQKVIGLTLFKTIKGKIKTATIDNKVYAIELKDITYNQEEMPDNFKTQIAEQLFLNLLIQYAEEIMLKHSKRHSFLHSIIDY